MTRPLVRPSLLLCGIGALALLGAGCGSGGDPPADAKTMSFTLTDAGCEPNEVRVPPGPVRFEVENAGTSAVTEFEILDGDEIVGEVENLSEGLSGEFSATLEAGRYTLYCPGGTDERGTLAVSN
jgi:iron uptake system component EfeO